MPVVSSWSSADKFGSDTVLATGNIETFCFDETASLRDGGGVFERSLVITGAAARSSYGGV